jgi:transcriptional regulator GlxA family with amidase domain
VTTQKSTEPEMIGFLMIPQFSMIAFSAAIEPLRLANYLSGQELYRWAQGSPHFLLLDASQ